MDTTIQIQALKSQIENMKLQIENIEMQYNNMLIMNNNQIIEQLLNLSIQMFNTGIQAFNTGKNMNMMLNMQKFFDQLKIISEHINSFINENSVQPIMIPPQMMIPPQIKNESDKYINIIFFNPRNKNVYKTVKFGTTVEQLLNQYVNEVYGLKNQKLNFIFNACRIRRDEQSKVENYFSDFSRITVLEIDH